MQSVTLSIALVASFLVFLLQPVYGLILYVAFLVYYPTYLSVQLGTLDFTVRRIIILAIFVNLFLLTDLPRRLKFIWLDKLVIIFFAAIAVAGATTAWSLIRFLENYSGAFFDMVLPYFAVRLIIRNRQQYLALLKGILVIAAPLAIVGFYQCLTGNNPVGFLKEYAGWVVLRDVTAARAGFFRADVTFEHPILYGLFFAMLGPVCAGLVRNVKKYKLLCWAGLGLMLVGVFASLSSGPWLAVFMAVPFIVFYRYRRHWRLALVTIVVLCAIVEIISNRHFYEVIDRFTISGSAAWYRSRLIQVALFEGGMSGHWVTGYGWGVDPRWCDKIDLHPRTDIVNYYLAILSNYGLLGLVPFLVLNMSVARQLTHAFKATTSESDRWLIWCLAAGFLGLWGAIMTVSLYDKPVSVYYMMIGFAGAICTIVKKTDATIWVLSKT